MGELWDFYHPPLPPFILHFIPFISLFIDYNSINAQIVAAFCVTDIRTSSRKNTAATQWSFPRRIPQWSRWCWVECWTPKTNYSGINMFYLYSKSKIWDWITSSKNLINDERRLMFRKLMGSRWRERVLDINKMKDVFQASVLVCYECNINCEHERIYFWIYIIHYLLKMKSL